MLESARFWPTVPSLVLVLASALPAADRALPEGPVPAVVALARARAGIATLRGRFTYDTRSEGTTSRRLGDFAIQRVAGGPPRYHLLMARPDGTDLQRWCSDGQRAWTVEQAVADFPPDTRERKPGADGDIRRVVDCVLLEIPTLTSQFIITTETTEAGACKSLTLTPRSEEQRKELASIKVVLTATGDPDTVVIDDGRGTVVTVTISDLVTDQPIPAELFRVGP